MKRHLEVVPPEPVPAGDLIDWSADELVPVECVCPLAVVDHLGECQRCRRPKLARVS